MLGEAEGSGYQGIPHHPAGAPANGPHPAGARMGRLGWTTAHTQGFFCRNLAAVLLIWRTAVCPSGPRPSLRDERIARYFKGIKMKLSMG